MVGGRCRSFYNKNLDLEIDNGNHLLLGINENILSLLEELETKKDLNEFEAKYKFFNLKNNKEINFNANLNQVFKSIFQPKITQQIYNNVATSIFNTEPQKIPFSFKLNTFLQLIKKGKNGLSYYYPKANWEEVLNKPLQKYLPKINFYSPLKKINFLNNKATELIFENNKINVENDVVILAAPMNISSKLLNLNFPQKYNSIINIHFKINHNLKPQIIGFLNSKCYHSIFTMGSRCNYKNGMTQDVIDWLFIKNNILSTTKSSADVLSKLTDDELVKQTFSAVKKALPEIDNYNSVKIIKEKRATFACEKEVLNNRPEIKTKYHNLFLTGDYIQNNLPATLEGCVINAKHVVELIRKR